MYSLFEVRGMFDNRNVLAAIRCIAILTVACLMAACDPVGTLLRNAGGMGNFKSDPNYGKAYNQRQMEMRDLPERFYTDSLVTEGAVIPNRQIFSMLTERGLRFVEVKARRFKGKETIGYFGMTDVDGDVALYVPFLAPGTDYVRLALADGANPESRCIQVERLPQVMKWRMDDSPLLPGTCISATPIEKPTARMALVYEGKHPWGTPFGYWSLVDRTTGQKLAALTSADSDAMPSNGNSGHRDLVHRIWNAPGFSKQGYRALFQNRVKIESPPPTAFDATTVKPYRVRYIFVTEKEYAHLFNRGVGKEGWQTAVQSAMTSRWGYDGPHLLDWQSKTYTELTFPYPRTSTAVDKGFFAINGWWDHRTAPGTLERYDSHGKQLWSVLVSPPNVSLDEKCGGGLAGIGATKDYVVFYGRCGSSLPPSERPDRGHEYKVMLTEIRRSDLPNF